jgi:hypothetical protein
MLLDYLIEPLAVARLVAQAPPRQEPVERSLHRRCFEARQLAPRPRHVHCKHVFLRAQPGTHHQSIGNSKSGELEMSAVVGIDKMLCRPRACSPVIVGVGLNSMVEGPAPAPRWATGGRGLGRRQASRGRRRAAGRRSPAASAATAAAAAPPASPRRAEARPARLPRPAAVNAAHAQ